MTMTTIIIMNNHQDVILVIVIVLFTITYIIWKRRNKPEEEIDDKTNTRISLEFYYMNKTQPELKSKTRMISYRMWKIYKPFFEYVIGSFDNLEELRDLLVLENFKESKKGFNRESLEFFILFIEEKKENEDEKIIIISSYNVREYEF